MHSWRVRLLFVSFFSVGSGKSSLLSAIIGDMLFTNQSLIDQYGGLDAQLSL